MLPSTTSVIGPATLTSVPCGDAVPVFNRSTMCCVSHAATPASRGDVSDGAYQFCTGINPPARSSVLALAPSALRLAWQALQWPRASTR